MITLEKVNSIVEDYTVPSFVETQQFLLSLCSHGQSELSIVEEVNRDE